jgi:acyl-CoA thioesterase FadM
VGIESKIAKLNKEQEQKINRANKAVAKAEHLIMLKVDKNNKRLQKIDREFRNKHHRILR